MKKTMQLITVLGLVVGVSGAVQAQLVTNGSFESSTNGPGQLGYNTNATGWTIANGGYNFLFASGTADTTGSNGQYGSLKLWGPGDGSANGLPASSPDGGNYIGADGAFQVGAISQTITGLTAGTSYTVGFDWAGAQQSGFTGPNTEQWIVSFGSQTQSTAVLSNSSHGFTGWQSQAFTFTADGSSDVLSFLANGTPSGEPPFSLLDGVTVMPTTPEGSSLGLLSMGLLSLGGLSAFVRRARAAKSAKSAS